MILIRPNQIRPLIISLQLSRQVDSPLDDKKQSKKKIENCVFVQENNRKNKFRIMKFGRHRCPFTSDYSQNVEVYENFRTQ